MQNKFLIIGHRGSPHTCPENTSVSFKTALQMKADGIETDLQLTADGEIVIHHNYRIDETSNGEGPIYKKTLAELKSYDFGSYKSSQFSGEKILSLDELLALVQDFNIINLELKPAVDKKLPFVEKVLESIDKTNLGEKIIISSFDQNLIKEVRIKAPKLRIGWLVNDNNLLFLKKHFPYGVAWAKDEIDSEAADHKSLKSNQSLIEKDSEIGLNLRSQGVEPSLINSQVQLPSLEERLAKLDFRLDFLNPHYLMILQDPSIPKLAHELGLELIPYTVDKRAEMEKLLELGCKYIITNRIDLARQLREAL